MTLAIDTEAITPAELIWVDSPLKLQDRCDRCGAQAFVRTHIPHGDERVTELIFCVHHFRAYEPKLRLVALHIDDQSERVNKKPSISANSE
jgi:hypothetical protein